MSDTVTAISGAAQAAFTATVNGNPAVHCAPTVHSHALLICCCMVALPAEDRKSDAAAAGSATKSAAAPTASTTAGCRHNVHQARDHGAGIPRCFTRPSVTQLRRAPNAARKRFRHNEFPLSTMDTTDGDHPTAG